MEKNTKSLRERREEKVRQFNEGIAVNSLQYLKQMNKEVSVFIESNSLKSENIVRVRKQNKGGKDGI